jgi:hypothetical protein
MESHTPLCPSVSHPITQRSFAKALHAPSAISTARVLSQIPKALSNWPSSYQAGPCAPHPPPVVLVLFVPAVLGFWLILKPSIPYTSGQQQTPQHGEHGPDDLASCATPGSSSAAPVRFHIPTFFLLEVL